MPRHLVEAVLLFVLNVSAVCVLCSYDLIFENQFLFYDGKGKSKIDANQIIV